MGCHKGETDLFGHDEVARKSYLTEKRKNPLIISLVGRVVRLRGWQLRPARRCNIFQRRLF